VATVHFEKSRPISDRFYVAMALVCALIAFGGFASTYWLQLLPGTFVGPPILHLHGWLYSAWVLLFLSQTLMIARGNMRHHQAWGVAGVSLATAMVFVGLGAGITSLNAASEAGQVDAGRAFFIVPATAVLLFAGFFTAAIANVRRPEWHKRLMLVATISLLQAPIGRMFFLAFTGGGPGSRPGLGAPPSIQITIMPGVVVILLIVAAIVHDWRTRGRPHPAYLWGLGIIAAIQALRPTFSETPGWAFVAEFLAGFSG
jgi:hypothetical protein